MFVSKINTLNFKGGAVSQESRRLNDSEKLDLLIQKMNTLQMDVEKMRARQMIADNIMANGITSLVGRNISNRVQAKQYDDIKASVKLLNELA